MFEKFLAWLKSAGLVTDANEAEVTKKLKDANIVPEHTPQPAAPVDTSKLSPELKQLFEGFQKTVDALLLDNKELKATLTREQTERENGIKAQQDRLKAEKAQKVKDLVEKAKKDGKTDEAGVPNLTKLAEADYDATVAMVEKMQTLPGFKPAKTPEQGDKKQTQTGERTDARPSRSELFNAAKSAFAESMKN